MHLTNTNYGQTYGAGGARELSLHPTPVAIKMKEVGLLQKVS